MASRRQKVRTLAALAVVLLSGLGCQARHHLSSSQPLRATLSPLKAALPSEQMRITTARVFRGSVSSVSIQDDLIAR